MALVGAADGQRDIRDRQIGSGEELLRPLHAPPDDVLMRRNAGRVLEDVREVERAHVEQPGDERQRQALAQVRVDDDERLIDLLCRKTSTALRKSPHFLPGRLGISIACASARMSSAYSGSTQPSRTSSISRRFSWLM
jgi:hypothetical protein